MGEGAGTAKKQAGKHTMMVMDEEEEAWRLGWKRRLVWAGRRSGWCGWGPCVEGGL